jgi:hypothetical protein
MPETTSWTGTVWGTNRGNVLAEITKDENRFEAKLLVFEPGFGQTWLRLIGQWDDANKLTGQLDRFAANLAVAAFLPQSGVMEGTFDPNEGLIHGEWKTDAGTVGKFLLAQVQGQLQIPDLPGRADQQQVIPPPALL